MNRIVSMKREDLLEHIKELYNKKGKVPQRRDFDSKIHRLFIKEFGSFSSAIKAAGFKPTRVVNPTEEELLESLRNYYKKYGISPSTSTVEEGLYAPNVYLKSLCCKGWSEVLKKAGLPIYIETRKGLPTEKDEIISYARELIEKKHITSMYALLRHPEFYGKDRIDRIFGDARIFAEKIGMKYNDYAVSFSEIEQKILSIANELGRTPSISELLSRGISELHLKKKFGSYNELLNKIGLTPGHYIEICDKDNDELIKLYKDISFKNGFVNGCPFRQFKELSGIGADVLVNRFGSINSLRDICGYKTEISRQVWDKDSVYSYLRKLTIKENRKLTLSIIKASKDGPCLSTIRRYLDKPLSKVSDEIWNNINTM